MTGYLHCLNIMHCGHIAHSKIIFFRLFSYYGNDLGFHSEILQVVFILSKG